MFDNSGGKKEGESVFILFHAVGTVEAAANLSADFIRITWQPSWRSIMPEGWFGIAAPKLHLAKSFFPCLAVQAFYWTFKRLSFKIHIVYSGARIVHYCFIMPASFRLPPQYRNGFEIGPYWTDSNFRGHGLAARSVGIIKKNRPGINLYILMRRNNTASIRVAEKNGFARIAECVQKKKFIFSSYEETLRYPEPSASSAA